MRLSKQKLNKTLESQLGGLLAQVLSELKTPEEVMLVMSDVLTEVEMVAVLKRLGIALYLDKGRSYEDVKNNLKVSSATIATVSDKLGNPGWQEVVRRVKAEEWASAWTDRITRRLRSFVPR